jgi:tetratricopeptide (TPR) repeat protein
MCQKYFNQGLAFLFSFNHAGADRSFRAAIASDPTCPMAYWGLAMAQGPYINSMDVDDQDVETAVEALRRAREFHDRANSVEAALVAACASRFSYPAPPKRTELEVAYAFAMRSVLERFPEDADVGAFTAEAILNLRPWDQWDRNGKPQPGTEEIVRILEAVLRKSPNHPFALHLYIHVLEASPHPERAFDAANRLRGLTPGLEHLQHMPSHIDIRCGNWNAAVLASENALIADDKYRDTSPEASDYALSIAHDQHMLAYAAAMQGESRKALSTSQAMLARIPVEFTEKHAKFVDGYVAMRYEMLLRFGHWEEALKEAQPAHNLPLATVFWHLARGISLAAMHRCEDAKTEQRAFDAAACNLPKNVYFRRNRAIELVAIGEKMLAGEILYREHHLAEGITALSEAVRREDSLTYTEPPNWILHARHALGAALLEAGRVDEAEAVYRDDLAHHPENGWSLHGLAVSLQRQGRKAEAKLVRVRFDRAWQHADFAITSSCCCLPGQKLSTFK